jgi:RimJ/RimL family protein N-acetyltransferase
MATISAKQFTSRTGDPFVIRCAEPDDAMDLLAHAKAVAQESDFLLTEPDEFNMTEDEERKWIQDHLDGLGNICLLAEASGVIIGSLGCENGKRRRAAHRGTFGMAVIEEWRRQGVGTALLQCFLAWAESSPMIEKVGLGVFATNEPAIALYQKSGFVEEGRQPKEIKIGPGRYDDVILLYRLVG